MERGKKGHTAYPFDAAVWSASAKYSPISASFVKESGYPGSKSFLASFRITHGRSQFHLDGAAALPYQRMVGRCCRGTLIFPAKPQSSPRRIQLRQHKTYLIARPVTRLQPLQTLNETAVADRLQIKVVTGRKTQKTP